jgi:hypothetical protein
MDKLYAKLERKILVRITLVYAVVFAAGIFVFRWLLPSEYFSFYPVIGIFYWLMGIALSWRMGRSRLNRRDKLFNIFMIFRMIKLVSTLILFVVGLQFVGDKRVPFAVALMCNYFISFVLELYIYFLYDKRMFGRAYGRKNSQKNS